MDAQWSSVRSLALRFNSRNSVCTQVAIMGFWEAHVRCDELPPSVNTEFKGGGGDNVLAKDMSEFVFRVGETKRFCETQLILLPRSLNTSDRAQEFRWHCTSQHVLLQLFISAYIHFLFRDVTSFSKYFIGC